MRVHLKKLRERLAVLKTIRGENPVGWNPSFEDPIDFARRWTMATTTIAGSTDRCRGHCGHVSQDFFGAVVYQRRAATGPEKYTYTGVILEH
jgi:hypothetical protein